MAKRKYLIILLLPFIANANPWIPEKGIWKYSFESSYFQKPKIYGQDLEKFKEIEKNIILLQKELISIKNKISRLADNARNEENKRRLEIYKNNRIDQIEKLQKNCKKMEEYLYLDYKIWGHSARLEYGLKNDISLMFEGNVAKAKYSKYAQSAISIKYRIYENTGKILTLKTGLDFSNGSLMPHIGIIWGKSKKFKKLDSFIYNSLKISAGKFGNIYNHEATIGSRFPNDVIILIQTFIRIDFEAPKIYQNLLRKQYKIAKEIKNEDRIFALSLAYFEDTSLSVRKKLGNGLSFGIWGEI